MTKAEERAAAVASVKCKGCGVTLADQGETHELKLYSVGDGTYECENALKGACAA